MNGFYKFKKVIFNTALLIKKKSVEEDLYAYVALNIQLAYEFGDIPKKHFASLKVIIKKKQRSCGSYSW